MMHFWDDDTFMTRDDEGIEPGEASPFSSRMAGLVLLVLLCASLGHAMDVSVYVLSELYVPVRITDDPLFDTDDPLFDALIVASLTPPTLPPPQWIPEGDGPLPLSKDYRDKLGDLCNLVITNPHPPSRDALSIDSHSSASQISSLPILAPLNLAGQTHGQATARGPTLESKGTKPPLAPPGDVLVLDPHHITPSRITNYSEPQVAVRSLGGG